MSAPNRKGVTLIDVSVVLVILAIVAAIVLPMIMQARAESRKSDCKCKLKQIGLALHNYEETHKTFPPGWVSVRGPDSGEQEQSAYGWATYMLPFLDGSPLYKTIKFEAEDPSFQAQAQVQRVSTQFAGSFLPFFHCSSVPTGEGVDRTSTVSLMGTTSYVGNFGVGTPTLHHESELFQGIFGCNSRVRIRDIRDGTTNTVLVGERILPEIGGYWPPDQMDGAFYSYRAGIPRGTNPLAIVGTVTDGELTASAIEDSGILNARGQLNGLNQSPPQVRAIYINRTASGRPLNDARLGRETSAGFSSYHTGGAQFLMGDASVRFLSDTTDRHVYVSLMHRNNGQPLISK